MDKNKIGKVGDFYDALSRSYDELYLEEQSRKHSLVKELLNGQRFRLALDIGCGTGAFLQTCRCYQEAVGIDLSVEMVRKARSIKSRNVSLIVADASSLPIKEGSADLIVSISLAEAESTLARMLQELQRVAEKSSMLALTVFNEQETSLELSSLGIEATKKLSERENLYLIRLNPGSKRGSLPYPAGAL